MANISSRARAVYKQNTAVLYYEPSESEGTPVSTARIVPVGAANAARGGATLQLVGEMLERDDRHETPDGRLDPVTQQAQQPQVVEVEPPRAAARKRPGQKRSTRVIAYNVRIVAQGDEQVAYDAAPFEEEAVTSCMEMPAEPAGSQFVMPNQPPRYRDVQPEMPRTDNAPFEMPNRTERTLQDAQFRMRERGLQDMPRGGRFEMPHAHDPRAGMPYDMPERMPRRPMAGSIPMSLFGALENMGDMLHEQTRRVAARAHASVGAGSYKHMLTQQLDAGRGGLLSNRNMCIAVGAYALILFLLAVFTG